ncbi:MAG: cytochrome c oxidase subunit 2 [Alphaproteobacteria bacterium]|jgi:cytochrome c oxidase subunit 2
MKRFALLLGLVTTLFSWSAHAIATPGEDWQINFFDAASPVMEKIHDFHGTILMPIITVITLFVLALLIYVSIRFRKGKNPTPSKTTHHVGLEIAWTIIPVIILVLIAIPSIRLVIMQDETPKSDITIKAIGYQWYWGYEYPEEGVKEYSSYMRCPPEAGTYKQECLDELKKEGLPHKLAVDYPLVVPVNKTVRVLITAMDVIHAFAMPSFGVKRDAVPGRMNQSWFKATKTGTFYGQCSELCGTNHAFMPITVEVVPQNIYDQWLEFSKSGDLDGGNSFIEDYKDQTKYIKTPIEFSINYSVNGIEYEVEAGKEPVIVNNIKANIKLGDAQ